MTGTIGPAQEFWRLRLVRIDTDEGVDLEWRDDVLYRAPAGGEPPQASLWQLEAVALEDDRVVVIGAFEDEDDAREMIEAVEDDLVDLTRSQFEERYRCS